MRSSRHLCHPEALWEFAVIMRHPIALAPVVRGLGFL
jgi:hypothetical protein